MIPVARYTALLALFVGAVYAQETAIPPEQQFPQTALAAKRFTWGHLCPYQVDTDPQLIRGAQHGYNQCNSTTENQESLCQTSLFNSVDDFCIWGPPEYGREVGDIEGIMVAWCTKPGHGTRLIPEGAITGIQWIKTPDYVQAVGYIDQTKINVLEGDWGGEMDPHGADLRGNPIGGLVFSNAFGGADPVQVIEWHLFLGGNRFCYKACDPAGPQAEHYCEHIFDRIGCDFNIPNAAQDGVFESCEGDNMDFVGTYTGADGQTSTYTQPHSGTVSVPYTASIPASSNCVAHKSEELFADLPAATPNPSVTGSAGASASASASGSGRVTSSTRSGSSAQASSTDEPGSASRLAGFSVASVVGLVAAGLMFA
ncbi:macrophage activating glycoprotein [Coprinopsis sp. MPI-PUGE-AT-0042]|nr:macrophage activating glycoprotein [Coprinopsis sp. MPI-PUGE-AT-0042]